MTVRRILGVDPGLRTTGYGVIDCEHGRCRLVEGGILVPRADLPLEGRLTQLHAAMVEVVVATRPDCMVVEELWTSYKNPTTAVLMGHARGVIALAAGANGVGVEHLAHSLVKRALAGSGAAPKAQVSGMVMQLLGLRTAPQPADVSDALALAIAFANIDAQRARFAQAGISVARRRARG
ncbi:MAG: crossover junction endodeoxyribonuclease RuvC [Candidatus Velthaea sp.]